MSQSTFTFRVDTKLKDAFNQVALEHDRTSAQLMRDFMHQFIRNSHEEGNFQIWFASKVEAGRNDIAQGNFITQEEAEKKAVTRCNILLAKS